MMKLTVAFLSALAVADAANARGHRHVRRQYGYGSGPDVPTVSNTTSVAIPAASSSTVPASSPVAVGTTSTSPQLPSSSSSSSTKPAVPSGTAPAGTAPGSGFSYPVNKPSKIPSVSSKVPGVSFPGTGTAPAATGASPSRVATPLPSTSLSPVGSINSTASFPTFVVTGTAGSFPTYVPSGVVPSGTGSGEDLVTLTISSTQIFTVTACPSSVSNCPAKSTSLVTKVIPVGTTVCPSSEASKIVSSGLPSSAKATPTGSASLTSVAAEGTPVPSEVVSDETKTLTQTIGTGNNAHLTTFTVTNKVTKTVYVTKSKATAPAASSPAASQNGNVPAPEPTTYLTTDVTSTIAKTLTITEGAPGSPSKPTAGSPSNGKPSNVPVNPDGTPADGEGSGDCAPPVTVTVTAKETVTVTAGNAAGTPIPDHVPSQGSTSGSPVAPSKPAVPVKPSGKPTGAPFPTGNGTAPIIPGSTGFLTHTKPTGPRPTGGMPGYGPAPVPSGTGVAPKPSAPGSTGVVPKPSAPGSTDGLPSFVLPTATPASGSPSASPTPVQSTSVAPQLPPAESGAYGPGYGYGSKKRSFLGLF